MPPDAGALPRPSLVRVAEASVATLLRLLEKCGATVGDASVERAVGVLIALYRCDAGQAARLLDAGATETGQDVSDLARDIVASAAAGADPQP